MPLMQYIYSTTCTDQMTIDKAILISEKSVDVCAGLGLTGRVFSTRTSTFAITEGSGSIVKRYYEAVRDDPLVATMILHGQRPIPKREFKDYSVWLDINAPFNPHPHVHQMTSRSLIDALPAKPSARLRIMVDAYFEQGRLVA